LDMSTKSCSAWSESRVPIGLIPGRGVALHGLAFGSNRDKPGCELGSVGVRLLTYNVRSLRDDKVAVAAVIRACDADVVCIQEAPRFLRWRSKCAALARAAGLFVVTGGRTAGAMLLLARVGVDVDASYDVLLHKTPRLHQRGLAVGVLRVKGERYAVASMHLSLDDTERTRQIDEVTAHMERLADGAPIVVAGDVNETPDRPRWKAL